MAFQTAYLKANYPSEYMAAVLSRNLTNIEQLTLYMNECKRMGISVLGPDINESMRTFSSNAAGDVRFGLAAVKGVGEAAVESIIAERKANGRFKDIYDFIERVNYSLVNRKCLENLAYAGAFDSIADFPRNKFFRDRRTRFERHHLHRTAHALRTALPDRAEQCPAKPVRRRRARGHPAARDSRLPGLEPARKALERARNGGTLPLGAPARRLQDHHRPHVQDAPRSLEHLDPLKGQEIAVAGMVVSVQNLMTKTGKPWGKFKLEDYNGAHEFALFGKDYENFRKYLFADYFLFIRGKVQPKPYNDQELEFKIVGMTQLSEMRDSIKEMVVQLPVGDVTEAFIRGFSECVRQSKGDTLLRVNVFDREARVALNLFSKSHKVSLSQSLVGYLEENEIKYSIA